MRGLFLVALMTAACSYSEETPQVFIHVDGIPQAADHLDVVVTPSDTTVAGKNCTSSQAAASSATCYRPSFQPAETSAPRSLDLAFAAPATTGTFTVAITASGLQLLQPVQGTTPPTALPGPVHLQVTLH